MDIVKGASILAARIAGAKRSSSLQSSREVAAPIEPRCIACGGPIAEVLAVLGSLRCHDCRARILH
jgi:hypothetical protein